MARGPDPQTIVQRVLLLERQQGYQDRAAVGGLASFLDAQIARNGGLEGSRLRAVAMALQGYAGADHRQREAAVSRALEALLVGSQPAEAAGPTTISSPPRPRQASADTTTPKTGRGPSDAPSAQRDVAKRKVATGTKPDVSPQPEDLNRPLSGMKGMRKASAEALARLGVVTVRDLLYYFPRAHYDYTDTRSISRMRLGQKTTLVGTIRDVRNNRTRRGIVITTATIEDATGTVAVRWFNQPYLSQKLPLGARIAISGEPDVFNGYITFEPRDYELIADRDLTHTARLVPIYGLSRGLFQRSLRNLVRTVVDDYVAAIQDFLPSDVQRDLQLPSLTHAIEQYHFPEDEEQKGWAEQRLAFDELLLIQLGLLLRKQEWQSPLPYVAVPTDPELLEDFCASLPFQLTAAQRHVIAEILEDIARPIPMSRLLEGDVGSGKTVVAAAALVQVVRSGLQGVLMAPTEILAEQHFRTLSTVLEPFAVRCELLIGSTPQARRRTVLEGLRDGTVNVVVGTHALIQENVEFLRLGLAITDEQHRFGVEQRASLRHKGLHPHILAMTATPIPRTLAITIYGDLDVSIIDEMPPGRLPVITTWSRTPADAYGVVRDEVRKGHQAFVICPVIEDSADSDMRSVLAEYKELQHLTFSDLNVGLLHGRMKPREKDEALETFRRGEFDVLVATSVVEVGIDVPNATAMVIRDAHRFGLAQLHQFRGRVGRAGDQAFCVLLSASEGDDARERLEALTALENGFELAEEDLRLRGPGEFWGTRQSGLPELRVAQLGDVPTIELARTAAKRILDRDPHLTAPEHRLLQHEVERFWASTADLS